VRLFRFFDRPLVGANADYMQNISSGGETERWSRTLSRRDKVFAGIFI
jgi:hypothetical protein